MISLACPLRQCGQSSMSLIRDLLTLSAGAGVTVNVVYKELCKWFVFMSIFDYFTLLRTKWKGPFRKKDVKNKKKEWWNILGVATTSTVKPYVKIADLSRRWGWRWRRRSHRWRRHGTRRLTSPVELSQNLAGPLGVFDRSTSRFWWHRTRCSKLNWSCMLQNEYDN